jgi:hypothetical protein
LKDKIQKIYNLKLDYKTLVEESQQQYSGKTL